MMESASTNEPPSPPKSTSPRNPFFPMVLFSVTVFIITILAMVAVIFSDHRAPVARFLDANAGRLILAEVVVTLFLGLCALVVDRKQSNRERHLKLKQQSPDNSPKS